MKILLSPWTGNSSVHSTLNIVLCILSLSIHLTLRQMVQTPAGLPTFGPCFWWHREVDVASHKLLPPLPQGVCVKPTTWHPVWGANNLQPLRLPFLQYWGSCNPGKKEIWEWTEKKTEECWTKGVSRWESNSRLASSGQGTRMLEDGNS